MTGEAAAGLGRAATAQKPDRGAAPRSPRLAAVDLARGGALVAMILFHLVWDLDYFGLVPVGVAASPQFLFLGHAIAAVFLVIVGVSLALAARGGLSARPFFRRIAIVAGAALLITAATWIVFPNEYIFFGILHCIAVASLVAAAFLRTPVLVTFAAACIALALPVLAAHPVFNAPALLWLGLGTREPVTNDWAPFFPAFGFVLLGLAGAKLAGRRGLTERLAGWRPEAPAARLLIEGGRHSLAVYLVHQPLLFGAIFVVAALAGHSPPTEASSFARNCSSQCANHGGDGDFCAKVCACVTTESQSTPIWRDMLVNALTPAERERFGVIARQCIGKVRSGP